MLLTKMKSKRYIQFLALTALGLMFSASIATVSWGVNKSLGLGDEGIYLLSARYPEDFLQNVSAVYVYTGYLFRLSNYDPAIFRLVGLACILMSTFIFWIGFSNFFLLSDTKVGVVKYDRLYCLLYLSIGGVSYYQWFFATPNNYTLTAIAVNVFGGAKLLGLSKIFEWKKNEKLIFLSFLSLASVWA